MGGTRYGGGGRGRVYTYRYTVTTRMTCIKMGSDESHFNVSLNVRDKVTRQCPQTTTFSKRKENRSGIEPRSFRLPAYRLTARPNRLSVRNASRASLFSASVHWVSNRTRLRAPVQNQQSMELISARNTSRTQAGKPGESYRGRLRSLLLSLCDVFRALINSLVCAKNSFGEKNKQKNKPKQ